MSTAVEMNEELNNVPTRAELSVVNVHELSVGLSAIYVFDEWGGTIGSRQEDDWVLKDHEGGIEANHAEISYVDGYFCLTDNVNATFINGAQQPLGQMKRVRLNDKDILKIGGYKLRVNVVAADDKERIEGLEQAFSTQVDLLEFNQEEKEADTAFHSVQANNDPLKAFDVMDEISHDKASFEQDDQQKMSLLTEKEDVHSQISAQADSEYELGAAITLKKSTFHESSSFMEIHEENADVIFQQCPIDKKGAAMTNKFDNSFLDEIEKEMEKEFSTGWENTSNPFADDQALMGFDTDLLDDTNHLVVGPMLKGLGVKVGDPSNMGQMQALSQEIGQSLQAAIKGLLALHQQVEESRFGVMNKNLQPIEDNPLRLGLDYKGTVETLYEAQRSMVHLSAPSAIEESLTTIRHHNEAVQEATTHALTQILHAFSPDVLMRRFSAYQRTGQVQNNSPDAWAWSMYQNYFKELTSNRQKGFEKLFWEIFEQAYDKKIRELQRET